MTRSEALKLSHLALNSGLDSFKSYFCCSFDRITFQKWGNQRDDDHKSCTLIYIIEGRGVVSFANGKTEQVGPGDIIQQLPGRSGVLDFFSETSKQAVLTIPEIFYNIYSRKVVKGSDSVIFHIGLYADLVMKFRHLQKDIDEWATPKIFKIIEKAVKLISEIQGIHFIVNSKAADNPFWITVQRDLCRDLKSRFSLPDFAKKFSMSYSSFRHGFTRHVGISPGSFHINQRIEQVKMLLAGSQISLKEVARRFNYPDLPSFSKQFKKITGITPRTYIAGFNQE